MSNFIPEEVLDDIQSRCDIVEIISGYIPLKRIGANYKALCPFHNEKTPSFIVSPTKQIYHCFGCGAGGNVFGFIMNYERLDFVEAVRLLADKAGVVIPEKKIHKGEEAFSKGLWEVNKFACDLFHKWLYSPAGKNAYQYIKGRGIKDEVIKKFLIGYAPAGNELLKSSDKNNFPADLLIKAGLAVRSEDKIVDMFRNRLMFPIFNAIGKVVGFSGRVLDNGLPKYINTPETYIFHKGKILYGMHVAKADIAKEDRVVICEGYFDFLRAYQEGIHGIVASQGTAFTVDHVNLLRRYASSIVISFDGDSAGDIASLRGLQMFLEEGVRVKVALIPKGHDPDTFIKEKGIDEFKKLIEDAQDILDIKLARLCSGYNISSTEGKLKVMGEILPDIVNIRNEIQKAQFIKQVANKLNVPEDSIWMEIRRLKKSSSQKQETVKKSSITENIIARLSECPGERQLVQLLMDEEPLPEEIADGAIMNQMKSPEYKTILGLIINLKKTNRWKGPRSMAAFVKDEGLMKTISRLAAEEIPQRLDKRKNIRDCIYDVKRRHKEEKMRILISRIEEAEKNKQDISGLVSEMNNLKRELVCRT